MAGKHVKVMTPGEKGLLAFSLFITTVVIITLGYMMTDLGMSLSTFVLIIIACQVLAWVLCWFSDSIHFGFRRNHGKHRL